MNTKEYIESGVLELYVLGLSSAEQCAEIEALAAKHPEIYTEIAEISVALEKYAQLNEVAPHPLIKPLLMATIDYTERLKSGEPVSFPAVLNENSKIEDYQQWINREDMKAPVDFEEVFAKIIGYTPEATSAIVWIKNMAPEEVHDHEFEKFLILEGTCDITIGDKVHQLVPGDYLSIPLHVSHNVKVTSKNTCKVILQRIAA